MLREMEEEDFASLYRFLSDPLTMQHYPQPYDEKGARRWMDWSLENYKTFGFGLWAVILKETNEMIGDCGITMQIIHGHIKPEVGYHIHADYWGHGYGKEAAIACRDWCFENSTFQTVYSYMDEENIPSQKTAMANGMSCVDEYQDGDEKLKVYAIDRETWQKIKKQ